MEHMEEVLRRKGTTLYTDTSEQVRRKERSIPPSKTKGRSFEDMGSDFSHTSKGKSTSRNAWKNSQETTKDSRKGAGGSTVIIDLDRETSNDSDDELDCLPKSSPPPHEAFASKGRTTQTKGQNKGTQESGITDSNGVYHPYVPEFPANKQYPRFKKIKKVDAESNSSSQRSQSSGSSTKAVVGNPRNRTHSPNIPTPSESQHLSKTAISRPAPKPAYVGGRKEVVDVTSTMPVQGGSQKRDVKKGRYDPLNELSSNHGRTRSQASACSGSEHDAKTPRPAAGLRPKPRPAFKGPSRKLQEFPSMPPLGETDAEDKRKGNNRQGMPSDETSATSRKGKGKEKQTEDPFTALSPLSVQKQDIVAHRKSSSKGKIATSFPDLSPLSSPAHKGSLQSSKRREKYPRKIGNGRTVVVSSSEEHTDDEPMSSNYQVRPFPMETQMLESIGHSPGEGVSGDDSDGTLDNDLRRKRKKRRADPDELLAELLHTDGTSDFDEEDLLFLNPNIDPKLLCPWCDEMLPPAPSPHLMSLMAMARKASWLDPRPTNPHGLRAPLGAFVGVCQRHRFENHHIPLAQQRGWPMQIDWDRVGPRVEALKPRLQAIVDDVDEDFQPGASHKGLGDDDQEDSDDEGQWTNRPRKGSVLWRDVVKSVKKKGSRQTASVSGQFTNFSKSQPGYYGELGHVIIHQTIYNLFPPASFPADSTLPLTPTDFIQIILVPEAAISLIMEDLDQTREEAIETLRESAEYGVAMFPDDHAEGVGAIDVGDQIIRERARARRKELEEEERIEEEMWGVQGDADSSQPQGKGKRHAKSRKTESESDGSDTQWTDTRRAKKSGRKPTAKSSRRGRSKTACSDADTESDVIMVSDTGKSTSGRATWTRSTTRAQARSTNSRSKSKASSVATLSDIEMDPREDNAPKPPPRPRPRWKGQEPSSSQSRLSDKEKENLPASDMADCDVLEVTAPPLPSQSVYSPVARRTERARRNGEMSDVEATPRPNNTSRAPDVPSRAVDLSSMRPLQRARAKASSSTLKIMKCPTSSLDKQSITGSLAGTISATKTNREQSRSRGEETAKSEAYDWLLEESDASTPMSSQ